MNHALDRNVHREPRLMLELEGSHEIFRFAVNMLDDQVEFFAAGRVVLVELQEMVGPERFEPWAKSLLGEERYQRLSPYFLRDDHCISCERSTADTNPPSRPLAKAAIVCPDCDPERAS